MGLQDIFSGALTPAKWRELGEYLGSSGMVAGPGLRVRQVGNRSIITTRRRGGGGGTPSDLEIGAFYTIRTDSESPGNGDRYLQGGLVTGGEGNATVADIKLYDAATDTWRGTAGKHLQLEITGDGQTTSGILDPSYNVTAAAASVVTSISANTLPKAGSTGGKKLCVSLGIFSENGFSPAGKGNYQIGFCAFNYNISRF
ncbi:MAG: hypothetical protein ACRCZF_15725 [Gemmataceae bacterium]